MKVRPFNKERELYTASAFFGDDQIQSLMQLYIDELRYNEIPNQRDMERNPEERKP